MTTGNPESSTRMSEVIDIMNEDSTCDRLAETPYVYWSAATGGYISEEIALLCGGWWYPNAYYKQCDYVEDFIYNSISENNYIDLKYHRYTATSIAIGDKVSGLSTKTIISISTQLLHGLFDFI